ncbi:hypothetical protein [Bradyrhizobium sp. 187]|jgi:hypothetical protein|uniref:hypothetical protein n=1 Tax=Bradyrhizobium sp. 187 TaxID=2782655 RepID=UPI001FFF9D84|nr:hypothetical protein [Bradyrhizobium sp. 187]UPJ74397.1 hypothetical protein IVB19_07610 [Bradyrhizobium sp. 187]
MGIERMHSPKYWLARAEEFHTKADNCEHMQARATLRQVAKNYEAIARRAQQILTATEMDQRRRVRVAQEYADNQRVIMAQLRPG